ncbi:hypothetical protein AB0471_39300 [Streptomyces sp. NPDC052002]|uniref:hypothetical protein n=2 Tax=unclassified Streptomyces TaxID=2593676 RepID=UPI00344E950C
MTDLPDRLRTVLTERFTELGNPFSAMRRHEQGPDGWPASHPVGPHQVAEVLRELLATDQHALPTPADRAAVLREAAARYEEILAKASPEQDPRYWTAVRDITLGLRRMADEAQQPEGEARPQRVQCGDCGAVGPVTTGEDGLAYLDPSGQIGHQSQIGPGGVHVFGTGHTQAP